MVIGKPTDTDPQLEFLVLSRNVLETLKSSISLTVACKSSRVSQLPVVILDKDKDKPI